MKTIKMNYEEYESLISNIKELEKAIKDNGYISYTDIDSDTIANNYVRVINDQYAYIYTNTKYFCKASIKTEVDNDILDSNKRLQIQIDQLTNELNRSKQELRDYKELKHRLKRFTVREFKKWRYEQ